MQGVILAAGKGKRLHPLTLQRSKAMAPVAGKPIVERVLETLSSNGIKEFILLVSPEDNEIVPYFQERVLDVEIRFVTQSERLGMAHALRLAAPFLHGPFVMSACDNLTPPEHVAAMIACYQRGNFNAVLSLMEIDIAKAGSTGIVEWQAGNIRRIVEKPKPEEAPSNVSSLPLYLFSPKLLDYLPAVQLSPRGEYELQEAIQMLIDDAGKVTGVLTPSRVQLTTTADLLALNRYYLEHDCQAAQRLSADIDPSVRIIAPVRIEPDVTIEADCVIGPNVYIESGCQIASGAQISEAVILRNTMIAADRKVHVEVVMTPVSQSI